MWLRLLAVHMEPYRTAFENAQKIFKEKEYPWIWGQIAMKTRALASAIRQKPVRESWRNITAAVGMTF